jgi:hypothetical protein
LEKEERAARVLFEANKEKDYFLAAIDIYNSLRASWERALEDVAFSRVILRHKDYINTNGLKNVTVFDQEACDKFEAGFKKCCDLTDSHDASRERNADPPGPAEMLRDIQDLSDWVNSLKDKQKQIAHASTAR